MPQPQRAHLAFAADRVSDRRMNPTPWIVAALGLAVSTSAAELTSTLAAKIDAEYPSLDAYYRDLHAHPELSLQERETSAKLASQLRAAGFEVTEHFGGYGIVAVLKNGSGRTVLVRSDMDALPVAEETGLPYASTVRATQPDGHEVPVMHACGHDIHMTSLVGTARMLSAMRDQWHGTVILIGQPAEERGVGARAMLAAGLYTKFPKPDAAIAFHDSATLPAGTIGINEGFTYATVDWANITVRGVGGHGAYPQNTKDPVVLASRIVLALQTLVSRETRPLDPAVITVGSIHGGEKANVIPNEVKLQLTIRSYKEEVAQHLIEGIKRTCRGEAIAAGIPEDRMPIVEIVESEHSPAVYNTPELARDLHDTFVATFGAERVITADPEMGGEDFSEFGRTPEHVPLCMFRVGAVDPVKVEESKRTGVPLPSLHSSKFAPVPEPTIKAAITAMTTAVMTLIAGK
jgi:hippurate hydrolase